jgi:hypothetical protein
MSVDSRTQPRSLSQFVPIESSPRHPGKNRPQLRPDPARIFRIVRRGANIELGPVTPQQISEAAKRKDQAARLLTAMVLHTMRSAQRPDSATPWTRSLDAYLTVRTAEANLAALPYTKGIPKRKRAELRATWSKQVRTQSREAVGFGTLLAVTGRLAGDFDAAYAPTGKPSMAAIDTLYNQTGKINHPMLGVLPSPTSYGTEDPRRNTIIQTDRLLRYIWLQAQPEAAPSQLNEGV